MNKKKFKLITLLILVVSIFQLESITGKASEFNFAVTPVIPENQVDKRKTFFDLQMEPGAVQTVEVQLKNDTDNDVVIKNSVNSATTNLNGVVEYGENKIKPDNTLKFDIQKFVELEKEVTIPKQSQIIVPLKITMPKDKFDGVIAGGLTLQEKVDDSTGKKANKDQGVAIKNEYSYVIAILLRQNNTMVKPSLKLLDVKPSQVNYRNVINIALQNPQAAYVNQLRLVNKIYKEGKDKVLYSSDVSDLQVAPNSHFSYPISLNGEKLEPGKYVLKSEAYAERNEAGSYKVKNEETYNYKWEFEKSFTIAGDVAKELNKKDVTIEEDYQWLYILIGILLLIIALLIIWWYRRKKKNETEK